MNLKDRLKGEVPDELLEKLSNGFHVIGDIAMLQIAPELEPYKEAIGQAVLTYCKGIRTVLCKRSKLDGERRLAQFDHLCGNFGVQIPVRVETALVAAPCVELPVNASLFGVRTL